MGCGAGPGDVARASPPTETITARILVPLRLTAWMGGDMGQTLERCLLENLKGLSKPRIGRVPRAFVIQADEAPGPLLEAVYHAARAMEAHAQATYPVFHRDLGPVWTGSLQVNFDEPASPAPN
jgi:hypothetical protein